MRPFENEPCNWTPPEKPEPRVMELEVDLRVSEVEVKSEGSLMRIKITHFPDIEPLKPVARLLR